MRLPSVAALACSMLLAGAIAEAAGAARPPDISGPWIAPHAVLSLKTLAGKAPPLTAAGQRLYAQNRANLKSDPMRACLPGGNPRLMNTAGYPFNVVQGSDYYAIMFQWNHRERIVFMNSEHFKNLGPGYFGQAVGHWEGATLVVDTTGYNDRTWLDDSGLPHSKQLHTVERIRLRDPQTLEVRMSFSDPAIYTHDWEAVLTYRKRPGVLIEEDNCVKRLGITLESKAEQKSGG